MHINPLIFDGNNYQSLVIKIIFPIRSAVALCFEATFDVRIDRTRI